MNDGYSEGSGIYAFYPFERLNKKNEGVFKIGNTDQHYQQRLSSYHTYFPMGVWLIGYIKIYPKKGKARQEDYKKMLNKVENYIIDEIGNEGGTIIYNSKRIRMGGRTEWVKTNINTIQKVFKKAIEIYKKEYENYTFKLDFVNIKKTLIEIQKNYEKRSENDGFMGEYVFKE